MNNIAKDILCQIIKTRKVNAFNEFSQIELGGKLVMDGYTGKELRVFNYGDKTHIMMPLKSELTPIQESTLADAIESGAIFDDASRVDDAATYATVTALPTNAMTNRGISVPTSLITLSKPVIGTLDDNCHAQCGQTEIDNGAQFLKDVARTGETGNTVGHVVGDYLGVDEDDENSELPEEIAGDVVDTEKALRNIVLNSPEDTITEEDYEDVPVEEGFFSMLSPDTHAKLIYHLNTMNDIVNNPLLPDAPVANDKALPACDELTTEGKQVSKVAEKCVNKGNFDRRTAQLLSVVATASAEMSVAADTISNPFLKSDDIMANEPGTKEAVDKWTANKKTLQQVLPQVIAMVENGKGKDPSPVAEGFLNKAPKKLKDLKMRDTISYITLEIADIKDVNDAQILSGYVCQKMEITDFYISCLDNNDPKYIVPHTRPQLVQFQNDLNRLLTQILKVRPVNRADRTWMVNVNYPEGWRG